MTPDHVICCDYWWRKWEFLKRERILFGKSSPLEQIYFERSLFYKHNNWFFVEQAFR